MPTTTRRQRTTRKLLFPLIAAGLMTTMMYVESRSRPQVSAPGATVHGAAARTAPPHTR